MSNTYQGERPKRKHIWIAQEELTGNFLFTPHDWQLWQYRDRRVVSESLNELVQRNGFMKNRLVP